MPKCEDKGRKNSIADKYYGIVKVEKWPEDLDELAEKQMAERLRKKLSVKINDP